MPEELTNAITRLTAAAEALEATLASLASQQDAMASKIDRIIAAIDEAHASGERATTLSASRAQRKTLPALVTSLLSKNNVDDTTATDSAALDRALASLPPEQRIAVKAEMARAGIIQ